ncbi:MAG TPA: radical SAM protein [Spirochaetota bacterium]|nr:radical SAM protein [Spirochaetota bacterium]HOM39092.1 radical SAM protein [Spirochaetota bacterium]HPQ49585.1 radical SAM protein [Spirochaetota bacterium]
MIDTVFIDPTVRNESFIKKFLNNFKGKIFYSDYVPSNYNLKKTIFLTEKKGGFLKECPCSPSVISCSYHNINIVEGCTLNCNYCAIDAYLDFPAIKVYTNLDDFEKEVDYYLSTKKFIRIGTGELTDSLLWENFFNYAEYLINIFSRYDAVLEFKTKTTNIKYFLENKPYRNIIVSWSLNTQRMIENEEKGNTTLKERLDSIIRLSEKGYKIGVHFDPLYYYDGCFEEYEEIISSLFPIIKNNIGWVSVGMIRFNPKLLEHLYNRKTSITSMEILPSFYDGKLRFFYPLRLKLFKHIIDNLKKYTNKIYLCMEPYFVWEEVGLNYKNLNQRIYKDFFI